MQKSVKLGLFVLCVALACLCGCKGLQAAHGHATPEAAGMSGQDQNRPLVLTNCRIIDGTGRSPLTDGVLVVADGRIAAVGKIPKEAFPADCRIIDLQGATVLPGLVNAHVHNAYREAHAALWASCGVTTVRDLSCGRSEVDKAVAFRDRARANPRLCRVVSAGSMITVPWGYMGLYGITVRSERDARAKVQKQLDAGVDCLKITLQEPAFTHPANLSPALAGFITALAHERGVPVTAHVGTTKDLRVALDCGVDDIAHVTSDELTDELIDRMVKAGVYLEPTLTNYNRLLIKLYDYQIGSASILPAEHMFGIMEPQTCVRKDEQDGTEAAKIGEPIQRAGADEIHRAHPAARLPETVCHR